MNYFDFQLPLILILILCQIDANKTSDEECPQSDDCHVNDCGAVAVPDGADVFVNLDMNLDMNSTALETYDKENLAHHKHKSRVLYRCSDKNDLLVGNEVRECNRGKWLGEVPRCAINLMNETKISTLEVRDMRRKGKSSSVQWIGKFNTWGAFTPPLSKQPKECLKWKTNEQQMWIISLSSDVNVHYIRFKLFAENLQQLWINRDFIIQVFLHHIRGMAIECEYNPHPNNNSEENYGNDKKLNKNFLTLEYGCDLDVRNQSNIVDRVIFNFSYVKRTMKISSMSLCDLRLYYFEKTCGPPDYPLTVQVHQSYLFELEAFEQWEFLCKDNEHTLEGKTHVGCGPNGKWMDDFPFCVPLSYCKPLTYDRLGKGILIEYEETITDWPGGMIVPNGKMARFSCNNNNNSVGNTTALRLQGITGLLCSKGKWIGLNPNEKPDCVPKNSDAIPFTKRVIRVLSSILIVCVILISILVYFMVRARRAVRNKTLQEIKDRLNREYKLDYENEYDFRFDDNKSQIYADIPHIYYSVDDLDSNTGLQYNSIYKDDVSDKFEEMEKTNSIYSDL